MPTTLFWQPARSSCRITRKGRGIRRCEALMQQSKVQFVLSHAHAQAVGALDTDADRCAHVGSDVMVPVSRPDAQGKPLHRLDAVGGSTVPALLYSDESGLGRILRAVLGRRLERLPLHADFTAHAASVLRTMALDGRGLGWLPETLVHDDLAQGRLALAAGDDWNVPVDIRLYRERGPFGKAAEAFWRAATRAP